MCLEFVGTFAFAISGIRLAASKHYDWFGGFVCGIAVAIGGGTIRDVMLGTTPFWMESANAPKAIRSYLVSHNVDLSFLDKLKNTGIEITQSDFDQPSSFEQINFSALMVQTGYLSIKNVVIVVYVIYPHRHIGPKDIYASRMGVFILGSKSNAKLAALHIILVSSIAQIGLQFCLDFICRVVQRQWKIKTRIIEIINSRQDILGQEPQTICVLMNVIFSVCHNKTNLGRIE